MYGIGLYTYHLGGQSNNIIAGSMSAVKVRWKPSAEPATWPVPHSSESVILFVSQSMID